MFLFQKSQPVNPHNLIEKRLLISEKMLFCGWNLPNLEVNGIKRHSIIPEKRS